ncbi:CD226 antigen-like [Archocentrus centrarchus]|uniref:CD226 antigen-like n=1 Tax=Archocentrus centrarchus TaxID=63155 RepID=UPI0011E9F582|nr:CD226 antigen-like [Archocentrus centrarchus]
MKRKMKQLLVFTFFCLSVSSAQDQITIKSESGKTVILPCRAPNDNKILTGVEWSRPDLQPEYVLLLRDGHIISDNQQPSFKDRAYLQDRRMEGRDMSLILENVSTADEGRYECQVLTPGRKREKRAVETVSIINLRVAPPPDQKNITAESGQTVTLTCRAPNNSITVVEWSRADLEPEYVLLYRDDQIDPEEQHPAFKNRTDLQDRQMKDGDVSVILKNVTINDTGTYECRVFMRGTNRRKRAYQKIHPISIINLTVDPPGPTGGTTEDGGKEDGVSRGRPGLIVILSVPAVLIAAAVFVLIYRKHKQQRRDSYQPPSELQTV